MIDTSKKKEPFEMFKELPHLNGDYEVVPDWGYTPTLFHCDTLWHVAWIHCEEGDELINFHGKTPEEAIEKAYNDYHKSLQMENR